jgi:hypothetical protein
LFSRKLASPKMHEFANDWFSVLEKVQSTTLHIDAKVDNGEAYGLARSEGRGVAAHAWNMEVSVELLNAVNWWRKEANRATGNPRLDMVDVYTTLVALLTTVLRFSRAL